MGADPGLPVQHQAGQVVADKAGFRGHKQVSDGLLGFVQDLEKHVLTETQDIALEAAIAGEKAMHDHIDVVPSSLRPGKVGRNWTYLMNQSVTSDVRRRGNTITLRIGWLQTKRRYFLLQEYGTTKGDMTIKPMRALQIGHTAMTKHLTRSGVKVP